MRKIVLNISESFYERLRFEAIHERKDINTLIKNRLSHKPFHAEVEEAYEKFMDESFQKMLLEE